MSIPREVNTKITDCSFDTPMLLLGRCGENLATQLIIDASEWQDGSGTYQLIVKRADEEMFTATITQEDGVVTWLIPAAEIGAPGYGEIELNYLVGEARMKSARVDTRVFSSIEIDSLPPNGTTWSQLVLAAVGDARAAAEEAEETQSEIEETLAGAVAEATAEANAAKAAAEAARDSAGNSATAASGSATAAAGSATDAAGSATAAANRATEANAAKAAAEAARDASQAARDEILDPLASTYIRNTIVTCTLGDNGYVSTICHRDNATHELIRIDAFTYNGNIVTETRTLLSTGRTHVNVYDLDTISAEFNVSTD